MLSNTLKEVNKAIAEIGYPDAGYKVWMVQSETSVIRFMIEGFWPDQQTYDEIHEQQLYSDAINASEKIFEGLEWVEYHRFVKV